MKQTSKENLAEVGFELTTSGLQVQCSIPSELFSPIIGSIPLNQYLCYGCYTLVHYLLAVTCSTLICQMQCLIARPKGNFAHRFAHTLKSCVCVPTSLPEDSEQEYSYNTL